MNAGDKLCEYAALNNAEQAELLLLQGISPNSKVIIKTIFNITNFYYGQT